MAKVVVVTTTTTTMIRTATRMMMMMTPTQIQTPPRIQPRMVRIVKLRVAAIPVPRLRVGPRPAVQPGVYNFSLMVQIVAHIHFISSGTLPTGMQIPSAVPVISSGDSVNAITAPGISKGGIAGVAIAGCTSVHPLSTKPRTNPLSSQLSLSVSL